MKMAEKKRHKLEAKRKKKAEAEEKSSETIIQKILDKLPVP